MAILKMRGWQRRQAVFMVIGLAIAGCEGQPQRQRDWEDVGESAQAIVPADPTVRVTGERSLVTITTADSLLPVNTLTGKFTENGDTYQIAENNNDGYRANIRHARPGELIVKSATECASPTPPDPPCVSECLSGHGNCLLFNGYGTPTDFTFTDKNGWSNDRLELTLSPALAQPVFMAPRLQLKFGQKRYLRFYFKVGADFEIPQAGDDIIISQVWQYNKEQISRPPPFVVALRAGANGLLKIVFMYANNTLPAGAQKGFEMPIAVPAETTIQKNTWYNFHIMLIPQYSGSPAGLGGILIWKNLGLSPSFVAAAALNYANRNVAFGYHPTTPDTVVECTADADSMSNCFDMRVGIYRDVHHELGNPSKHQPVYFHSLKLTSTEAAMNGI
jgi:hypothetical protein